MKDYSLLDRTTEKSDYIIKETENLASINDSGIVDTLGSEDDNILKNKMWTYIIISILKDYFKRIKEKFIVIFNFKKNN